MKRLPDTMTLVVHDLLLIGLAGGIAGGWWRGEDVGWSFLAACLWLSLNFTGSKRAPALFIFVVACAKIPASYFLLYRLYTADYLDVVGLTAGLLVLPVVLLYRGMPRRAGEQVSEDG
jgi:hypothetical protein